MLCVFKLRAHPLHGHAMGVTWLTLGELCACEQLWGEFEQVIHLALQFSQVIQVCLHDIWIKPVGIIQNTVETGQNSAACCCQLLLLLLLLLLRVCGWCVIVVQAYNCNYSATCNITWAASALLHWFAAG